MVSAVFLDRDGVLIEDVHLLTDPARIRVLKGVAEALQLFSQADFKLIVISNQTVVARGLATEDDVLLVQREVEKRITDSGGPSVNGFYFCPHHPNATLIRYRENCECRKPRPGLLVRAALEHGIDTSSSFMIGDRITDVIAGARAGCRTVLVQTGRHVDAPIQTVEAIDSTIQPDYVCSDLNSAAAWILNGG